MRAGRTNVTPSPAAHHRCADEHSQCIPERYDAILIDWGQAMRAKNRRRCPVLVELGSDIIKSDIFASDAEQPAEVAIKLREKGWSPYRVRFDDTQAAWIVSSLD